MKFSIKKIAESGRPRPSTERTGAGSKYVFSPNKWLEVDTERDDDSAINIRVASDVEYFKENKKFEVVSGWATREPVVSAAPEPVTEPEPEPEEVPVKPKKKKKKRGGK